MQVLLNVQNKLNPGLQMVPMDMVRVLAAGMRAKKVGRT